MEKKGKDYDCISEASNHIEEDVETHGSSKGEQDSTGEDKPAEARQFLGIQMQPGVSVSNLIAIPYIHALITAGVIYCSTRMLFMLRDKDFFAIENSRIGRVNSSLLFNSMIATIPIAIVSGYCYDIFGRKFIIIFNQLLLCALCFWAPYTSPSLGWLQLTFLIVRGAMVFVTCNPLIADYVDQASLGKATALQNMGSLVGDCFAVGVLMALTANMTHFNAFLVTALFLALLSLPLFCLISEPNLKASQEAEQASEPPQVQGSPSETATSLSYVQQVRNLSSKVA